jgi:peptidoglycan/LPS O-acetylase OafA/YrhL
MLLFTPHSTLPLCTEINSKKDNNYLPQLDSLRALAVLLVVLSHYWREMNTWYFFSGRTGVLIFFMISGYLITGILLDSRDQAIGNASLQLHIWKRFFQRRALRIFPLYYAVLLLLFALGFPDVRQYIWWHLAYLTNFLVTLENQWFSTISHFWSLAIEEQFYVFWPAAVLFLPDRFLRWLLLSFLVIAPAFRLAMLLIGKEKIGLWVLPLSVVDSLGLGSLLAYLNYSQASGNISLRKFSLYLTCIGLTMALVLSGVLLPGQNNSYLSKASVFLYDTSIILSFSGLFIYILQLRQGWGKAVFTFRPLVYVGKISYGIYVFHIPVMHITPKLFSFFNCAAFYTPLGSVEKALLWGMLTLLFSTLSWVLLERRLNQLKRYFPYLPKTKMPSGVSSPSPTVSLY